MLQESTISFLSKLAKNNNKAWFDKNRKEYEAAKADFEVFVSDVLARLAKTEPMYRDQKAKDCIFRIFRDVRFSKDKTPYKPNFGAGFSKGGKKFPGAGYYLHIEPGKCFIGGGIWQPEAPTLKALRQEIDYNFKDFKKVIDNAKFKKLFPKIDGDPLKTLPKGYTADNPAIEYLKMRSFTVGCKLDDKLLTSKKLADKCLETFAIMKPFIDFLDKAIG